MTKEQNKMTHEHRNEQKETQRLAGVQTPPPSTGLAVFSYMRAEVTEIETVREEKRKIEARVRNEKRDRDRGERLE